MLTLCTTDLAGVLGGSGSSAEQPPARPSVQPELSDYELQLLPNCNPGILGWQPGNVNPCVVKVPRQTPGIDTLPSAPY
jgi:hypothetical protein